MNQAVSKNALDRVKVKSRNSTIKVRYYGFNFIAAGLNWFCFIPHPCFLGLYLYYVILFPSASMYSLLECILLLGQLELVDIPQSHGLLNTAVQALTVLLVPLSQLLKITLEKKHSSEQVLLKLLEGEMNE